MKSITFGVILIVVLSATAAMAGCLTYEENRVLLSKLDRNNDGFLQPEEVDLGLLYRAKKGKVDLKPPTAQQVSQESAKDVNFRLLKYAFEKKFEKKEKYSFDEIQADDEFDLKPDIISSGEDENSTGQWYLRRTLEKIPKDADSDILKKVASDGAMLSYAHAYDSGADEWLAQGVLAYAMPLKEDNQKGSGLPRLSRSLASLEFSRIHFEGEGKPKESSPRFLSEDSLLNAGYSYETLVNWPQCGEFTSSVLRVNALWKTDFDFESHFPTGEAEWTFHNGEWGLGSFNYTYSNYIWFRFNAMIHADGGYVVEDGKWTKSVRGDAFAHIGPQIGVTFMLLPTSCVFKDNPLVLSASYGQFFRMTSQAKEIKEFTADMSWYIRKPGGGGPTDPGLALTLSYRDLKNVENKSDDNSLIAGIAVGF